MLETRAMERKCWKRTKHDENRTAFQGRVLKLCWFRDASLGNGICIWPSLSSLMQAARRENCLKEVVLPSRQWFCKQEVMNVQGVFFCFCFFVCLQKEATIQFYLSRQCYTLVKSLCSVITSVYCMQQSSTVSCIGNKPFFYVTTPRSSNMIRVAC